MIIFLHFTETRNVVSKFFKLTAQTQFIAKDTRNLPFAFNYLVWRNLPRNWPTRRTSLGDETQYNLIFILTLTLT